MNLLFRIIVFLLLVTAINGFTTSKVSPVLENVHNNCDGTYSATFGYNNNSDGVIQIPIGSDNRFTGSTDRGQPMTFLPGRHQNVFDVTMGVETIVWTLTSSSTSTATASSSAASNLCTNPPPTSPEIGLPKSTARKQQRPVLFVHGYGDDAQVWGVEYSYLTCQNPTTTILAARGSQRDIKTMREEPTFGFPTRIPGDVGFPGTNPLNPPGTSPINSLGGNIIGPVNTQPLPSFPDRRIVVEYRSVPVIEVDARIRCDDGTIFTTSESYDLLGLPTTSLTPQDVTPKNVSWDPSCSCVRYNTSVPTFSFGSRKFELIGTTQSYPINLAGIAKPFLNEKSRLFCNRCTDVTVSEYERGSAPAIMAREFGLDTGYDPQNPLAGINSNGIYFYNARNAFNSISSQADQLSNRIADVLALHYGADWHTRNNTDIDLIGHSQGGVVIRQMIKDFRGTTGTNPVNHINRILTVDTPHSGSVWATNNPLKQGVPGYENTNWVRGDILKPPAKKVLANSLEFELTGESVVGPYNLKIKPLPLKPFEEQLRLLIKLIKTKKCGAPCVFPPCPDVCAELARILADAKTNMEWNVPIPGYRDYLAPFIQAASD